MESVTNHEILRDLVKVAVADEATAYRLLEIARNRLCGVPEGTVDHFNGTRMVADALRHYRSQRDLVGRLSRQAGPL